MHGLAEAPRVIDPAKLTEQTASGPVVALVARRGDGYQARWRSPMLGSACPRSAATQSTINHRQGEASRRSRMSTISELPEHIPQEKTRFSCRYE